MFWIDPVPFLEHMKHSVLVLPLYHRGNISEVGSLPSVPCPRLNGMVTCGWGVSCSLMHVRVFYRVNVKRKCVLAMLAHSDGPGALSFQRVLRPPAVYWGHWHGMEHRNALCGPRMGMA